jgi:hypothetical protein
MRLPREKRRSERGLLQRAASGKTVLIVAPIRRRAPRRATKTSIPAGVDQGIYAPSAAWMQLT